MRETIPFAELLEARALMSATALAQIQQPEALSFVLEFGASRQQIVAVLDTGLDPRAIPTENLWVNPGEIPGDGIDNDGNGYADDVSGWNFTTDTSDTRDAIGHGSRVASVILQVDPGVKILPIKLGEAWTGEHVLRAVKYVEAFHARGEPIVAANMSFGGGAYDARHAALFASSDIVWVASAGNNNRLIGHESTFYPASYDGVLSVAANTTGKTSKAPYSNHGAVDVSAPGTWTTRNARGYLSGFQGTSAAAPSVAGVVSLVARIDADKADIVTAIFETARPNGFTRRGLVDAFCAVTYAQARAA